MRESISTVHKTKGRKEKRIEGGKGMMGPPARPSEMSDGCHCRLTETKSAHEMSPSHALNTSTKGIIYFFKIDTTADVGSKM